MYVFGVLSLGKSVKTHLYWGMKNCCDSPDTLWDLILSIPKHYKVCVCVCACVCARVCAHVCVRVHACVCACVCMCACMCVCACMQFAMYCSIRLVIVKMPACWSIQLYVLCIIIGMDTYTRLYAIYVQLQGDHSACRPSSCQCSEYSSGKTQFTSKRAEERLIKTLKSTCIYRDAPSFCHVSCYTCTYIIALHANTVCSVVTPTGWSPLIISSSAVYQREFISQPGHF